MTQKQQVGPPPPDDNKKEKDGIFPSRKMAPAPQVEDTLAKLDKILNDETEKAAKKKPATPQCCGILPCKGRTPFCFQCDLCMDCITGSGCGHADSRHSFVQVKE